MRLKAFQLIIGVFVLLCSPILAFGQGLYWETTTSLAMGGEQKIDTKSYYLPRMFKQTSDKEATVFRLDKQMVYSISYDKKEYSELTFAQLDSMVGEVNKQYQAKLAEFKKQIEGMPADQRKAMEAMMASQLNPGGAKIDVAKTKETKTISGYACGNYVMKQDTNQIASVWTTTQIPGFKSMQKDFTEFSQRLASQMTMSGAQMAEAMTKLDGFLVEMKVGGMTATVNKVSATAVAKSEFEVPAGFTKVPFAQGGGKRGKGLDEPPPDGGEIKN
jgi:hypothetical protein